MVGGGGGGGGVFTYCRLWEDPWGGGSQRAHHATPGFRSPPGGVEGGGGNLYLLPVVVGTLGWRGELSGEAGSWLISQHASRDSHVKSFVSVLAASISCDENAVTRRMPITPTTAPVSEEQHDIERSEGDILY